MRTGIINAFITNPVKNDTCPCKIMKSNPVRKYKTDRENVFISRNLIPERSIYRDDLGLMISFYKVTNNVKSAIIICGRQLNDSNNFFLWGVFIYLNVA
jgi:hypothetical protein